MKTMVTQKQILDHFNLSGDTLVAMEKEGLPFYRINARDIEEKLEEIEHEYENIIVHLVTFKACIEYGIPEALEHSMLKWVSVDNLLELEWAPADIPTIEKLQNQL
ncbi:hypothetical protein CN899_27515 [Bacillus thuringiensis]|uniref:DNA mismatch repair protein MutT n=1 Tax=Bacillus thuringiensis TaxID=1428 RepID=A0A9X7GGV6_BACTU|nr:hypothetical protein CN899_27515 [Bacillus thuringiensis]